MKKKIQTLVGGLALAAIVGVNGYMVIDGSTTSSELDVTNVERLAEGWEWSDLGIGKNWREDYVKINCDDFDYAWYYMDSVGFGPCSIQLPGCKRRGIKSVRQCCSGGGDCIVSQSTNCNDW